MKRFLFTTLVIGFSAICNAQQKQTDTPELKLTPITDKDKTAKTPSKEAMKFTPPVIVKDKTSKKKSKKENDEVKFVPPVIVKDSARNE